MESTRSWLRVPWRKSGHENRDPIRVPFLCDHDGVPGDTNAHPVHCVIKPVLMAQWRVKVHLRAIDLDGGGAGAEASSTESLFLSLPSSWLHPLQYLGSLAAASEAKTESWVRRPGLFYLRDDLA